MILEARGLTKRFGPLVALDGADLDVAPGEVHAVLGENGAGKSTLMNLLFGALQPDAGTIRWRGGETAWRSPADALAAGIGMVHQHFTLVPALTVWENIWLSHPARPGLRLDPFRARRALRDLSDRFTLDLDPGARVEDLPVGTQQRVEIAKALAREPDLLILDEPTAVLAPDETRGLFEGVRALTAAGTAILFISHKLEEVLEVSDRITVLRRGRVTASCARSEADVPRLTGSIIGDGKTGWSRAPRATVERVPAAEGDQPGEEGGERPRGRVLLEVAGLSRRPRAHGSPLRDIGFTLRAGDVLGVAGVAGNGQRELVSALAGVDDIERGSVRLLGRDVTAAPAEERWRRGLSVLPGDRGREGLALDAPVWENLALRQFGAPWAREGLLVDPAVHVTRASALIARHDVRASGPEAPARSLSGGNQQKLLLARELAADPKVLVLLNPTRGLDIGAADTLLRTLRSLARGGRAVLLVSTELDEILAFADRFAVMYEGLWSEVAGPDRAAIGARMIGAAV